MRMDTELSSDSSAWRGAVPQAALATVPLFGGNAHGRSLVRPTIDAPGRALVAPPERVSDPISLFLGSRLIAYVSATFECI